MLYFSESSVRSYFYLLNGRAINGLLCLLPFSLLLVSLFFCGRYYYENNALQKKIVFEKSNNKQAAATLKKILITKKETMKSDSSSSIQRSLDESESEALQSSYLELDQNFVLTLLTHQDLVLVSFKRTTKNMIFKVSGELDNLLTLNESLINRDDIALESCTIVEGKASGACFRMDNKYIF